MHGRSGFCGILLGSAVPVVGVTRCRIPTGWNAQRIRIAPWRGTVQGALGRWPVATTLADRAGTWHRPQTTRCASPQGPYDAITNRRVGAVTSLVTARWIVSIDRKLGSPTGRRDVTARPAYVAQCQCGVTQSYRRSCRVNVHGNFDCKQKACPPSGTDVRLTQGGARKGP